MKMFAMALLLMLTCAAKASEIKVLDMPSINFYRLNASFKINKELNRAWVEVAIRNRNNHPSSGIYKIHRQKVPGLSYDEATSSIVLDADGQLFECAKVVTRTSSIFWDHKITNTNCSLTSKEVTVIIDNGFELIKERRLQVFLVTK
jgi:hypothetical protein